MKFTSAHLTGLLILAGITGVSTYAKAQENRPFPEPGEVITRDVKIEYNNNSTEPEPVLAPAKPQRDSVQVILKPAAKPPKGGEKGAKDKQEDPLSFNFLYYIIEKFKLSDIIE
jgi:hypothetical protein